MTTVTPVSEHMAAPELKEVYAGLRENFALVPNFFAVLAHRPGALRALLPFLSQVIDEGTVEPRLKELAYLKVSLVNGCEY